MSGVPQAITEGSWSKLSVLVTGLGVTGYSVADALMQRGARVMVVDERDTQAVHQRAAILEVLDVTVRLGDDAVSSLPPGIDLVVTSPGWKPSARIFQQATRAGIPVWGDVELAWHLRDPRTPWLVLTGTNGKTTTVRMLTEMLRADGARAIAAGNVGEPLVSTVTDPDGFDVIAVELSSYQLHYTYSMRPHSAAVLNVAPDHVDWHGSFDAYAADKARIYEGTGSACVYNVSDPQTRQMVIDADVTEGARAVGFTVGVPDVGMVGVVDDMLVDRAFIPERHTSAAELAALQDVQPYASHNVANALAAAALARSFGVSQTAVRDGLRSFQPDPHRISDVATIDGVRYVDDSKATNPHAAAASLSAYDSVVWIAGGLAKGATFDELVQRSRQRLRGVVLLGADRALIADALARHAPDVHVVELSDIQNDAMPNASNHVMEQAVSAAARLARPGDTVLLAPACASMDMFDNYSSRGDAFASAVRRRENGE